MRCLIGLLIGESLWNKKYEMVRRVCGGGDNQLRPIKALYTHTHTHTHTPLSPSDESLTASAGVVLMLSDI